MANAIQFQSVLAKLEEFKKLLAPAIQTKIQVTSVYRARSTRGAEVHWPKQYGEVWGRAADRGVYLHFDEDERLLYVGKAASLGRRLACYYVHTKYPDDKSCKAIDGQLDKAGGSGIRVIPLDEETQFLGPAIEAYLIYHLNPPLNTQGRNWALQDT